MESGLIGAVLATHSPRMADPETAPEFVADLIAGAREMGGRMRAAAPDVLVLQSAHWQTTMNWYAGCQQVHEGRCVATEAPDMIPGLPYRRKGEPDFARALVEALTQAGLPAFRNESPDYVWDYGALVPLLHLDPEATLPVVTLSTCMAATLDECLTVGESLARAAGESGRRVLFVASGALSHELVRSPASWPTPERQEADRRFIGLLEAGEIAQAREWLPEFSHSTVAEVGGRHLATLLGALSQAPNGGYRGQAFGYGPSSGSGNTNVLIRPAGE